MDAENDVRSQEELENEATKSLDILIERLTDCKAAVLPGVAFFWTLLHITSVVRAAVTDENLTSDERKIQILEHVQAAYKVTTKDGDIWRGIPAEIEEFCCHPKET